MMLSSPKPLSQESILLVAEYYPIGGTRTYVKQLLDFYHRMGASVTLVTTLDEDDSEIEQLASSMRFELVTYAQITSKSKLKHPSVWSPLSFMRERHAFREFVKTRDFTRVVVSAGTPGLLLGALNSGPRAMYVLHTYPHGRRQALLARPFLSRQIPKDSNIICVSTFQQDIVQRLWRTERRGVQSSVIANTCGAELYCESTPSVASPKQVLTAAMVEDYKQPLQWIEVATQVSHRMGRDHVRFVWIGDGSLLNEARVAAASVSDFADIRFLGRIASPESFYRSSHLYFQFSTIENMSIAVIDALRHGLPAVVTNVGALPEIVSDGQQGYVVSGSDENEAVEAIQTLLIDDAKWSHLSANAKRRYRTDFSQERWDLAMMRLHS